MNNICRKYIIVKGIVQGVGFRPFVYNTAMKYRLRGWVKNSSEGVFIDIEGSAEALEGFLEELEKNAPPLSKVESIVTEDRPLRNFTDFTIRKSEDNHNATTLISPDIAICKDCERELLDESDYRYRYPFINCTNCGPRFTIIERLPYDRPMTTMKEFKMCPRCRAEYENPADRRFHAQPVACGDCGPWVWLSDAGGGIFGLANPMGIAARLILERRQICAIKGIGGFHIACDATDPGVIRKLRERKQRPAKPFAVMMKDIETVKKYCEVDPLEEEILTGIRKPILLLRKKEGLLPEEIAPANDRLGVMLPYTPLHVLLFQEGPEVLIMTSANISGLPIVFRNSEARKKLAEIADFFVMHDRDILVSVDDSVSKVLLGKERLIRRSRGYAPVPVRLEGIRDTLACGAHLNNTFCISKNELAFMSQHIGDMENLETYENFERNVEHFKSLYDIKPELVAHDMHPDFLSADFAAVEKGLKIPVQHHHAHIASCMVDNGAKDTVIGLSFDGTGYGTDGRIWGGEFLLCDLTDFKRVGHLRYTKMPGGEAAIREPWRMALGYLYELFGMEIDSGALSNMENKNVKTILSMLKNNINCPETSSMGRLFDAVSALIGVKDRITFEGEAAIALEAISDKKDTRAYSYEISCSGEEYIINTDAAILGILGDMENKIDKAVIAQRFHNTVIGFSIELCRLIRDRYGKNTVALGGGVFQNEIILTGIYDGLTGEGFEVLINSTIPCNDGGLSIGQLVIANNRYESVKYKNGREE